MTQSNQAFAYHIVPDEMRGHELLPLNAFGGLWPDLHAQYSEKYSWRKALLERRIPKADCLWNDVVHLLMVHPHEVFSVFREAWAAQGKSYERELRFLEIPLDRLPLDDTYVYWIPRPCLREDAPEYTPENQAPIAPIPEELVTPFSLDLVDACRTLPDHFREYVHFQVARQRLALLFATLPHVLVKGKIDVTGLKAVPWSQKPVSTP